MVKPKQKAKAGKPGKRAQAGAGDEPRGAGADLHVVQVVEAAPASSDLGKKELIDAVAERSGAKKNEARPVIEAMLAVLGDALAAGRGLNLEPLGKLRVNRTEEKGNRRVVVAKLRQSLGGAAAGPETDAGLDDEDSDGAPD